MPFFNLSESHFSSTEKATINDTINKLQDLLKDKMANLTAEENKRHASINEKNKLVVNKAKDYYMNQPDLASKEVDWDEFLADMDSRNFIQATMDKLHAISEGLLSAKILHDADAFKVALVDKNYTDYMATGSSDARYKTKSEEYRQFFEKDETKKNENNDNTNDQNNAS